MTETLPPLVDETALAAYLEEHLPGPGDLTVERHQAGHSNETFFVRRGADEWVLRRPPRGAFLPSAHDVLREYRVLDALGQTPVRVPRTILACDDTSVIGAAYFLMERVHGVVIRQDLPDMFTEPERARIGDELVDALVELHSVDPASCGLDTFAKPTGYLERQLKRWTGQLELTIPHSRPVPHLERVGDWLRASRPETQVTTIVQGDYKLDNVIFAPETPARLVAILDWEMSTLGDPLADLGWMISFWREPGDGSDDLFAETTRVTELPGFRSRAELIDRYAAATGRDVESLGWYTVLAIWKLAILLEGSYARHLAGMTDDPFFAQLETGVPALAQKALEIAHV
ncbi:MAG TPA: phosphotransferase family protein [Actinomycetota bacterium]|nr:phosphotransferase family protein [Actinomycetota bacterium]